MEYLECQTEQLVLMSAALLRLALARVRVCVCVLLPHVVG